MKYKSLVIGEKIARVPIVQGGMGVGVSLGNLAGAVAKSGGVGIISTAQIGYREDNFEADPLAANLKAIESEYEKARGISPDGVIGFNIMVALKHYREYVIKAAHTGADIIISGAGLATELPEYVKGLKTKIAPIVSSEKAAKILLKMWDRKYSRTADMVVIEGPKAGGHLGFSKEEALSLTDIEFGKRIKDIIAVVKEYASKYNVHIPVVAAGGINDKEDVKSMFDLGVDGVQVASRFVTTYECDAHENFKQKYIDAAKSDIRLVTSPVGMPGRAIENDFIRRIDQGKQEKIEKCYGCLNSCDITKIPYCITDKLIKAVKGDTDNGLVFCGANTYTIKNLETVQEVIDSLMK